MNNKKMASVRKSDIPLKLITKEQQSDNDIKEVFRVLSEKMNGEEYDEVQDYRKAVIILLDEDKLSATKPNYEYTVLSVNLPSSETIALLEIIKYDIIKDMNA